MDAARGRGYAVLMDNPAATSLKQTAPASWTARLLASWPDRQWRAAFVVALSMTLAYALAFYWQLDRPFWAGFSVVILAGLPTVGQSLQKGALRIGGTLLGGSVALCLMAALHQNHLGLLLALSLYMALTMYLMTGNPNLRYFYFIACIVTTIIVISAAQTPHQTFTLAVSRVEETLLGIGSHMLVSLVFMQPSSRGLLTAALHDIAGLHASLAHAFPRTEADMAAVYGLYSKLGAQLERATLLLPAVELENFQDYADRDFWKEALYVSRELAEVQRRWLGGLLALKDDELQTVFPDLDRERARLQQAADSLANLAPLADTPPDQTPQPDALSAVPDLPEAEARLAGNNRFRYHRQMRLMAELHALLGHLLHHAPAPPRPVRVPPTREILFTTPNRLRVPLQVLVQFWLLIPLWIWLNPPGLPTMTFVELTLIMALLSLFAGNIPPLRLLGPFLLGIGCVLPIYLFVYPAVTSPAVFLFLLFAGAFILCVLFPRPDQALGRNGFMLPWLSMGHFTNVPAYSFSAFANGAAIMILGILVVGTVHYAFFDRDSRRDFWNARQAFFLTLLSALHAAGTARTRALQALERQVTHLRALVRQKGGIEGIPADAADRLVTELGDMAADLRHCPEHTETPLAPDDDLDRLTGLCRETVDALARDARTDPAGLAALTDMRKALLHAEAFAAAFPGRGRHTLPARSPSGGAHAA